MGIVDNVSFENRCGHFRADDENGELFAWLIDAGLTGTRVRDLFTEFCERLNKRGVRLKRGNIALSAIHPQVSAFMYTWRRGEGLVTNTNFLHSDIPGEGWFASPFFFMLTNKIPFLHRPLTQGSELDFPVLVEFRDEGMTDWFCQIFDFGWGFENQSLETSAGLITSWASDRPGGFTEEEFRILSKAIPVFGLAAKGIASFRTARSMLETYIGRDTAGKVLSGQVRRGSVDSINAVLLYADLKGFTTLSDTIERVELVEMLDSYLDHMASPIEAVGGEILKFMGDGILATFELTTADERSVQEICKTALDVTEKMKEGVDRLNVKRRDISKPTMELDIALHVGEVMYGNVGSETRLDFTVIGPAVNEVSRIEALCDDLGANLVASGDFVRTCADAAASLRSCGFHELRGVREPIELFRRD
ncbi:adenylate/guanylate cyclase domain-containing protein [Sneathiella sp. CAU 1612]|uniref:Adenylate/guanylate cyclase domain-containing protein n=1 Tax=Sneathiella sedimenti TaxID=2816034 RepID=A0ABS3F7M3_9PROT|nr:adenylate/guanylate cyclase domain-containing protein [Sneathiella sedimenti]MBO0334359.1 adenylate/guanylate cyclase domain-containing protein [Sneathiella sedimenti]